MFHANIFGLTGNARSSKSKVIIIPDKEEDWPVPVPDPVPEPELGPDIVASDDLYITTIDNKKIFLNYHKDNTITTAGDLIINSDVQNADVIVENGDMYLNGNIRLKKNGSAYGDVSIEEGSFRTDEGGFMSNGGGFSTRKGDFTTDGSGHFSTAKGVFESNKGSFNTGDGKFYTYSGNYSTENGDFSTLEGDFVSKVGNLQLTDGSIRSSQLVSSTEDYDVDGEENPIYGLPTMYESVDYMPSAWISTNSIPGKPGQQPYQATSDYADINDTCPFRTNNFGAIAEMIVDIPCNFVCQYTGLMQPQPSNVGSFTFDVSAQNINQTLVLNEWVETTTDFIRIRLYQGSTESEYNGKIEVMFVKDPDANASSTKAATLRVTEHFDANGIIYDPANSTTWTTPQGAYYVQRWYKFGIFRFRFKSVLSTQNVSYKFFPGFKGYCEGIYSSGQTINDRYRVDNFIQLNPVGSPPKGTSQELKSPYSSENETIGYTIVNDFNCTRVLPRYISQWKPVTANSEVQIIHNLNIDPRFPCRYQITWSETEYETYPMVDMTGNYQYYSMNRISPDEILFNIYNATAANIHPGRRSSTTGFWLITIY